MLLTRHRTGVLAIVAVAIIALMALALGQGSTASAATQDVTVGSPTNRFTPNIVTVEAGDTVSFTWAAGVHTVVAEDLSLDLTITSSNPTGETGALTTPGTYYFYCSIHAESTDATEAHVQANDAMVGKIVVVEAGSATTTPTAEPTTPPATATPSVTTIPNGQCVLTVADATVAPGTKQITISKSRQGRAGYIAIHESTSAGAPGPVIGITAFQPAGTVYNDLTVSLDRALVDGETLWPMLHTEDNGNTTYDGAAVDLPTIDAACGNAAVANIVTFPMKITVAAATGGQCVLTLKDEAVSPNANKITIVKSQQSRAGYIAIHESTASGAPGPVIGVTAFQPAGTVYTNLSVTLDRALKNGETLFPMLHTEDNGNTTYDGAAVDLPTIDAACGNPAIAGIVTFPMKISFAAAPAAPATGTGVAPTSSSNNLLVMVVGGLLALTIVGGTTVFAVRRR